MQTSSYDREDLRLDSTYVSRLRRVTLIVPTDTNRADAAVPVLTDATQSLRTQRVGDGGVDGADGDVRVPNIPMQGSMIVYEEVEEIVSSSRQAGCATGTVSLSVSDSAVFERRLSSEQTLVKQRVLRRWDAVVAVLSVAAFAIVAMLVRRCRKK